MNSEFIVPVTLIAMAVSIVTLILVIMLQRKKIKNNQNLKYLISKNNKAKKKDLMFRLYVELSGNYLSKKYIGKIRRNLVTLSPMDDKSIGRQTVKIYFLSLICCAGSIAFLSFVGDGSLSYLAISIFVGFVVQKQMVARKIQKGEMTILRQMESFLSDVRHNYQALHMVDEAIYDAIENAPHEIAMHASLIYEILTSENLDEMMIKYQENSPNKFLTTFLAVCETTMRYGDKQLETGSMFLKNLNYLKQEINIEILKKEKIQFAFSSLTLIAITPVFFIKPLQSWSVSSMPELQEFFDSSKGTVTTIAIYVLIILVYQLLERLKEANSIGNNEHELLDKLLSIKVVNKLLNREINAHQSKYSRMNRLLKSSGERINVKQFLCKRILVALFIFLSFNVLFISVEQRIREKALYEFNEVEESNFANNLELKSQMYNVAVTYTQKFKNQSITKEELMEELKNGAKLQSQTLVEQVAQMVKVHIEDYQKQYFKWYILLFSLFFMIVAFQVPLWLVYFRRKELQKYMEDEVMQFQSIVLMLMNIDRMDVYIILEWMERFAVCFKESIRTCLTNYEKDDLEALEQLKEDEPYESFQRLVDYLIICDRIQIKDAFDEIVIERFYYQEKRKQENELLVQNKSSIGQFIGFLPLLATIFLTLIIPFIYQAFAYFSEMNESIGMK